FPDLESYIQEENLQYALVAKFSYGRPNMIYLRKIFTRHFEITEDCNLGLLDHRHVLVRRLSNQKDFVEIFTSEALFSLASAVGIPLQVDKATTGKSRPSVARFEGDLRSILDEKKKVLSLQQTGKEVTLPNSSNITSGKNSVDNLNKEKHATTTSQERVNAPGLLLLTATFGHKEDTEVMLLGTLTNNNSRELIVTSQVATRQLSSRFMNDGELVHLMQLWLLNQGKMKPNKAPLPQKNPFDVLRDENFGQYEELHGTAELSAESRNTLDLEKQIEQTGKLKERCHDDHTDQQALLTHEKESIVTKEIDGKEMNPNTPSMFISNQEMATSNLNEAKEKQGETSASRWEDLVEVENHTPTPSRSRCRSKLSPQALEFVPTSKTNASMAVLDSSSNLSATKVNLDNRDILPDLGNDISDGDDEDDMLDICFDKVAKDGDLSPRQQRSGSTKCKKKTYGRQHSWDGKVSEEFVLRHLPMRLAKENHIIVSTTLSRSNKSNKK
ncbi:hypothetical protein H5410_045559, partial [Solanum commersonii]